MNRGIDEQYIELLKDILDNGVEKDTRNGKVLSVFGRTIRYKFKDGKFPVLTTKKMGFKTIVTELLWFLTGQTNIKYLVDNNCHIWDGDCYQSYIKRYNKGEYIGKTKLLENSKKNRTLTEPFTQEEFIDKIKTDIDFANEWGDLGKVYGYGWRNFNGNYDQIKNVINLLKNDPDNRRMLVSAWNPSDLKDQVLPPCHYSFQFYTRELSLKEREKIAITKYPQLNETPHGALINSRPFSNEFGDSLNIPTRTISLMWNQRSVDTPLGLPFNIASYALLLEIIAKAVNMVPDELIANMGDCHIYKNQIEGVKEQINREPYELPTLKHMKSDAFYKSLSEDINLISHLDNTDFVIENYQSHPAIKMPLSN
jgi:thymidylate synthase